MKLLKNELAGFGNQIDLLNTVNGGVTLTTMRVEQDQNGYTVILQNPAYNEENYHVELKPNHLTVFTTLEPAPQNPEHLKMVVPTFLRHLPIPANVDTDKIEAIYDEHQLIITAPFKSGFDNLAKRIDIRKN